MFDRYKFDSKRIDLGRVNHGASTIYEALGIKQDIFDACMVYVLKKNSAQELVIRHKITSDDLTAFQDKTLTERVSNLWGIRKRTYEVSLETFIQTVLVYRVLVTDCIPCGRGKQFKEGMKSPINEIGACTTPNCPAHG